MKLSPLDIYHKEFKKSAFGYNVEQVEAFLDEVGMAYEKLLKDINALQDEKDRLQEKLADYQEFEKKVEKLILTAQETAKEQARQARKEAEIIIQKAEIKAEKIERETRVKLQEEYHAFEKLRENRELFNIRFKTLLQTHLEMLDKNENEDKEIKHLEEDVAASNFDD